MQNIYEIFHKNRHLQKKIIKGRNFTYINLLPLINKYLEGKENILDVGCGVGTIDFFMANKGKKVTGIDISYKAITLCKANAKLLNLSGRLDFFSGDFLSLRISGKFDLIICIEVLEHIKEDNLAIRKIHGLLAKNGVLILSIPSKNSPLFRYGLAKEFDKRVGHLRRYNSQDILEILEENNFLIEEERRVEGILRNFLFLNPIAKNLIRFIKGPISGLVTFADNLTIPLFGESDLIVVARKK